MKFIETLKVGPRLAIGFGIVLVSMLVLVKPAKKRPALAAAVPSPGLRQVAGDRQPALASEWEQF